MEEVYEYKDYKEKGRARVRIRPYNQSNDGPAWNILKSFTVFYSNHEIIHHKTQYRQTVTVPA
jgi:hypothetical protein